MLLFKASVLNTRAHLQHIHMRHQKRVFTKVSHPSVQNLHLGGAFGEFAYYPPTKTSSPPSDKKGIAKPEKNIHETTYSPTTMQLRMGDCFSDFPAYCPLAVASGEKQASPSVTTKSSKIHNPATAVNHSFRTIHTHSLIELLVILGVYYGSVWNGPNGMSNRDKFKSKIRDDLEESDFKGKQEEVQQIRDCEHNNKIEEDGEMMNKKEQALGDDRNEQKLIDKLAASRVFWSISPVSW